MELRLESKMMKGQSMGFSSLIWGVVFAVLAFAVLGLTITYTSDIMEDQHVDVCPTGDSFAVVGTYNGVVNGNNTVVNPVTGGAWGCCQTPNATDCVTWRTDNHAVNASFNSMESQMTIAEKQDSMANVIIAAAIITILIGAFGGLALYGSKR